MAAAESADPAPASHGKVLVYTLPREKVQPPLGLVHGMLQTSALRHEDFDGKPGEEHRILIVRTAESPLPLLATQ